MTHVTFLPKQIQLDVPEGTTILEAARQAELWISSSCGGQGMCTSCRVFINLQEAAVTLPGRMEQKQLGEEQLAQGIRLACQARLQPGNLTVTLRG